MVLQHASHEPLGTLLPLLKSAGFRIRYVNFARQPEQTPDLSGYNGLIILGGPMGVYETDKHPHLLQEMKLIEQALKLNVPILGICLGAQLIASVLSSRVVKAHHLELGWHEIHFTEAASSDPLLREYQKRESIFQFHQDMFDLPPNSTHLAFTENIPGQAFRHGQKVYGFQFHLEADHPMIHRWLQRPECHEFLERTKGTLTAAQIEKDTERFIQRSLEISRSTFNQFIKLFNLPEKAVGLVSDHSKRKR